MIQKLSWAQLRINYRTNRHIRAQDWFYYCRQSIKEYRITLLGLKDTTFCQIFIKYSEYHWSYRTFPNIMHGLASCVFVVRFGRPRLQTELYLGLNPQPSCIVLEHLSSQCYNIHAYFYLLRFYQTTEKKGKTHFHLILWLIKMGLLQKYM